MIAIGNKTWPDNFHKVEYGIPLVGTIAAGRLKSADAYEERFDLTEIYAERGCYLLRAEGDSMVEAGIRNGDFVLVEPRDTAESGEIVVAQIEEDSEPYSTVKYWYPERGMVRLQPANASMDPIYVSGAVRPTGVVVGVLRGRGL